jgi:ornithine--oxo-acid transaminase
MYNPRMASTTKTEGKNKFWDDVVQRGVHTLVEEMSTAQSIEMTLEYGAHNYKPLPISVATGVGAWVTDVDGKEYIDCVGSYSAVAQGHLCESIVRATRQQLDVLTLTSRAVFTRELALFLKAVCDYTDTDMACPMNTGAEAVETAIKLARKWAYTIKGVPDNKAEIIVAAENFHGRTTTIVGFSSEENYKAHFGPFTPGFVMVPFGDIAAVEKAINSNTAAVMMEPIQAEGGILFPPDGFMADLRKLCTKNNVLLIWDEIQTGFCRTGKRFAWQHEDAEPDLMCLGKALGGGIMPVAATVGRREVMEVFHPGDHGSTFGGNPLAAVIAIAAMAELESRNLAENSRVLGDQLKDGFLKLDKSLIKEVRGRGLLIGLEVKEGVDDKRLQDAFIENGILTKETRHRTFRFAPPLTIDAALVDDILMRVQKSLEQASS